MTMPVQLRPRFWDVVFSLKTFAAAMLALWIGLWANLPNPYWSVAAVYIVAHPLSGATTSKALYRLIGTVIGGAATVAFVPSQVNSPEILTLVIGLWMGGCLVVSLLDGTPRSYAFMLAGYTTAITGFAVVSAPDTSFDYALSRVEEIALGIICAAVINRLVFPRHTGPVLATGIDGWLKDGAQLALAVIRGEGESPEVRRDRQRLASDALELRNLTTHVAYDTSSMREIGPQFRVLQQRMVAVLPIISGLEDVLAMRPGEGETPWPAVVDALLDDTSAWIASGERLTEERRAELLQRIADVERVGADAAAWKELVLFNLAARIRDLIQIWSDCITLKQDIASGSRHALRWRRYDTHLGSRPAHRDYVMALLSGFSALLSTLVASVFWIASGWPSGSAAAMMAGVFSCIFATMDDPTPAIRQFNWLLILVWIIAFVMQFAVFPLLDGYVSLALALGLALIPAGAMLPNPALNIYAMVLCMNLPALLALQGTLSLDMSSFSNGNLAMILGIVVSAGVTAITRSVGAEWSVRRLARAGWRDIALVASRQNGRMRRRNLNRLLQRMIDRIGMLTPRLARISPAEAGKLDLLRDLRNGMNTIDLQQYRARLPQPCRDAVDEVLAGVGAHYRALTDGKPLADLDGRLLRSIDAAIAAIIGQGASAVTKRPRLALVGLRFNLFPDAPPFSAAPQNPVGVVAGGPNEA